MKPQLSFVICSYNRPRGLKRLLRSMARLSVSSGVVIEIVIVDDGSDCFDPREIVANENLSFSWKVIEKIHGGVSSARNAGLKSTSAPLVCFLADDYVLPEYFIGTVVSFFDRNPDEKILSWNIRSKGFGAGIFIQNVYFQLSLFGNARADRERQGILRSYNLPASRAATFRRHVFDEFGAFDESLQGGEDGEMGQRLSRNGIPVCLLTRNFIDHHEDKNLWGFLEQRVRYARNSFEVRKDHIDCRQCAKTRWILRSVRDRIRVWNAVIRERGPWVQYCLAFPGLLLFLFTYYGTFSRLARRQIAGS